MNTFRVPPPPSLHNMCMSFPEVRRERNRGFWGNLNTGIYLCDFAKHCSPCENIMYIKSVWTLQKYGIPSAMFHSGMLNAVWLKMILHSDCCTVIQKPLSSRFCNLTSFTQEVHRILHVWICSWRCFLKI